MLLVLVLVNSKETLGDDAAPKWGWREGVLLVEGRQLWDDTWNFGFSVSRHPLLL